ncbi:MAG: hypothetical protein IJF76_05275 [Clostridia bacterium]|nr:hypothetical protein [Clostridia bacterium]
MRKKEVTRLKNILSRDKMMLPENYKALLVNDINKLLSHYMELSPSGARLKLRISDDGGYEIGISCIAERLKDVPTVLAPIE